MKDITPSQKVSPLTAARREKGLNRLGLAFKANVSLKTVERLESGQTPLPNLSTAVLIGRALEIDPREIWPDLEAAA